MGTVRDQIPNALSISRIPASGLFLWLFSDTEIFGFWLALTVAITALATDIGDGYLARKWNITSESGYFLDGMGDKCFTVAICLVVARTFPSLGLLAWALITRELILYALRAVDQNKQENLKKLRSISLCQAGSIRAFFLIFFCISAANVHGFTFSQAAYWILILAGTISALFGWASIFFVGKSLITRSIDTR